MVSVTDLEALSTAADFVSLNIAGGFVSTGLKALHWIIAGAIVLGLGRLLTFEKHKKYELRKDLGFSIGIAILYIFLSREIFFIFLGVIKIEDWIWSSNIISAALVGLILFRISKILLWPQLSPRYKRRRKAKKEITTEEELKAAIERLEALEQEEERVYGNYVTAQEELFTHFSTSCGWSRKRAFKGAQRSRSKSLSIEFYKKANELRNTHREIAIWVETIVDTGEEEFKSLSEKNELFRGETYEDHFEQIAERLQETISQRHAFVSNKNSEYLGSMQE